MSFVKRLIIAANGCTNTEITYDRSVIDDSCVMYWTTVNPKGIRRGDLTGDERLTTDDAIYLLYSIIYGDEEYSTNQSSDFNGDGVTTSYDAVYLLYNTMFGAKYYPLLNKK